MRIGSTDDVHELLLQNNDVQKVFSDTKDYLGKLKNKPNALISALDLFLFYGLPSEQIGEYVRENLSDAIIKSIVEDEPTEWEKYGIFPKEYTRKFLENNFETFLCCYSLKNLPKSITPDMFLEVYTLKEIVGLRKLRDFFEDFKEAGGSVASFCEKYVKEIGYGGNPIYGVNHDDTLFLIMEYPEAFDFAEFIRSIDVGSLSGIKLNDYITKLRSVNAGDEVLCRCYRYA